MTLKSKKSKKDKRYRNGKNSRIFVLLITKSEVRNKEIVF